MKNARFWIRNGLLIAATFMMVSVMSGPGFAGVEKLWEEKSVVSELDSKAFVGGALFRDLVEQLSPAVVSIRSMKKITNENYPFGFSPRMKPHGSKKFRQRGEGSGFIIHRDGYILTNAHVVAGSDAVQVALADDGLFRGRLVGMDQVADIALIKIDVPEPLPTLPLGRSRNLKPGDWVMAIGSPFGLDHTVTVGIVSAKGRSLGTTPYDDYIQTDAPFNPGNSGGPLINTRGEVVGINTAILPMGQGLGFSLPIDIAKILVPQLKEEGRVTRSWLGVSVQDITLQTKESLGLTVSRGSLVQEVVADSPAFNAGVQRNDIIVEFDGHPIKNSGKLPKLVVYSPTRKKIPFKLVRGDRTLSLEVVLEPFPQSMRS